MDSTEAWLWYKANLGQAAKKFMVGQYLLSTSWIRRILLVMPILCSTPTSATGTLRPFIMSTPTCYVNFTKVDIIIPHKPGTARYHDCITGWRPAKTGNRLSIKRKLQ